MEKTELIAPCHWGMEAVLKREITDLGYEISRVEDGKVTFFGDARAVADANIFLRTADRILWKVGEIRAETFEELFEGTKAIPWERWIPANGKFWVTKATSVKSRLFSAPDIQSIMKKAMVERMKQHYGISWFPEDGASYPVRVTILKDVATICLDTTGVPLHKRGYRKMTVKAPVSETLAAGILLLTPWRRDRILVDPFCGSGTFPIEAAMIGANMAPGMKRSFLAQTWKELVPASCWRQAFEEARDLVQPEGKMDIQGYDIDPLAVKAALENSRAAGTDRWIHFQQRPVSQLAHSGRYGFLVTNPPYGERLEEKEALPGLYRQLGERFAALDGWSLYLLTAYEDAERYIGRKANKNRKIYNGMLRTYLYQFLGPKPPGKGKEQRR
ncbi:MAG: class I SAM-dependent RNA methyltransferase [Clostridiales bacterium]|nr:class I SAM-dependent RNA methyltransferase [Clostridiales bacterium]